MRPQYLVAVHKSDYKTPPAVKVVTQSVINTRKPTEIKGLWVFFVVKRGGKADNCFIPLKQYMEIYIQIVMKKPQYLVF